MRKIRLYVKAKLDADCAPKRKATVRTNGNDIYLVLMPSKRLHIHKYTVIVYTATSRFREKRVVCNVSKSVIGNINCVQGACVDGSYYAIFTRYENDRGTIVVARDNAVVCEYKKQGYRAINTPEGILMGYSIVDNVLAEHCIGGDGVIKEIGEYSIVDAGYVNSVCFGDKYVHVFGDWNMCFNRATGDIYSRTHDVSVRRIMSRDNKIAWHNDDARKVVDSTLVRIPNKHPSYHTSIEGYMGDCVIYRLKEIFYITDDYELHHDGMYYGSHRRFSRDYYYLPICGGLLCYFKVYRGAITCILYGDVWDWYNVNIQGPHVIATIITIVLVLKRIGFNRDLVRYIIGFVMKN